MKYKAGDEVLIKAEITDISLNSERPYFVAPDVYSMNWVSEEKIIPADKTYSDGLKDAWEMAKKIVGYTCYDGYSMEELKIIFGEWQNAVIFRNNTVEEALAKIEAYEKEKEIKVGDVVKGISTDGIVTRLSNNDTFYVMWEDGSSGRHNINDLKKTGKHIDIESLLRQIGE